MTEGACISILCECNMCPLCSSTRATPLKIITTARRSVHTLIGSNEVFRTKTLPFILSLILREPQRECQKYVSFGLTMAAPTRQDEQQSARKPPEPQPLIW